MNVSFNNINKPSNKNVRFVVDSLIIVGGMIAGIVAITPEIYLNPVLKEFLLESGGIIMAGLKLFEKLTREP